MSKAKARVFVPLTKVDEEQRLVYGRITQEILDKSGEIMDYETSKPLFEKWSNEISEASGGLSKGNLRVMHGLSVAGKLTDLAFNDDEKAIDVCSKVVDDTEWNKVLEGCYTGFSVGGSYAKRWTETVDGEKVKKFTAQPNEVSLVDNPCVPSATFSLVKADGAEEAISFKVKHDDKEWPGFTKSDQGTTEEPKDTTVTDLGNEPKNEDVVAKATEMAKAANDGTTWMNHVEAAREELLKATKEGGDEDSKEAEAEDEPSDDDKEADDDATAGTKSEKVTPAGVKQVWTASDGQVFEKKADAEAHEATLEKKEPTEAEKLKARLEKATTPQTSVEGVDLFEDYDRLEKVFNALSTPFDTEAGAPKLEKGMYSINRFSNVLSDMASLSRSIKAEANREGGDEADKAVSDELIGCVKTLGSSFLSYAKNQIEELLAGIDDEVLVSTYDYYYAAAKEDGENQLAKDICSVIDEGRDSSRDRREELSKSFGFVGGTLEFTDELSPPMQKRFDDLTAENTELRKVATEAVEKVEELAKRVSTIEDTPLPRAPTGRVALKEGDTEFFGKAVSTEAEKIGVLQELLKTHGPDGLALELIKVAQRNGQQLHLQR